MQRDFDLHCTHETVAVWVIADSEHDLVHKLDKPPLATEDHDAQRVWRVWQLASFAADVVGEVGAQAAQRSMYLFDIVLAHCISQRVDRCQKLCVSRHFAWSVLPWPHLDYKSRVH